MHAPEVIQLAEHLLLFDVAARVAAKRRLAHAARETAHMPAQVVHLQHGGGGWGGDNNKYQNITVIQMKTPEGMKTYK